ncbi:MAG TPA: hypothetical protein VKY89_01305, partial [Thermoanaerobaculia bacterium]|nr:hypothetical protein [Thermoanaerobaculia bacterium]
MSEAAGGNLYESVLAGLAAAPAGSGAVHLPPLRASAAVVPWRRTAAAASGGGSDSGSGGGLEVYWVKRGEALAFMGGWHAFPGGGLARTDAGLPVLGAPPDTAPATPTSAEAAPAAADLAPGILVCAIRELFEETGILLARPAAAGAAALAAARRALLDGRPFADVLQDLGLVADASRLVYAGRWQTPPFAPLRFDNRFFLLEWPPAEAVQPEVLAGELESGAWVEPAAAWQSWHRGEALAAPPILHLLQVLAEDGPAAGLPRLRHPVEADLGPVRRVELRPGVLMFPLATR